MTEERRKYMEQLRAEIEDSWAGVKRDNFHEAYKQSKIDEKRYLDILRAELKLQVDEQISNAGRYFGSIMAVGYAGYFATWFLFKDEIRSTPAIVSLVALLGFSSLTMFMLWEVFQMYFGMKEIEQRSEIISQIYNYDQIEDAFNKYNSVDWKYSDLKRTIWKMAFAGTVMTGLVGACVMLFAIGTTLKFS